MTMRIAVVFLLLSLYSKCFGQTQEAFAFNVGEIASANTSGSITMYALIGQTIYEPKLSSSFSLINFPNFQTDIPTGFESESPISIYPNPVSSHFSIQGEKGLYLSYKVYGELGKCEMSGRFYENESIDAAHLPAGLYVVVLLVEAPGAKSKSFKIIKTNDH